jgi:NADH-dependent peroxiredoxin subunit F
MSLPQSLLNQIKDAWIKIDQEIVITLECPTESSPSLDEARELVEETTALSEQLIFQKSESSDGHLRIKLGRKGQSQKIIFQGVPMGHELTSYVLAPLALSGHAKMPDDSTLRRIKALKGPIRVTSYVSLSCENCPTVVQAFNNIAAIHPNFEHTMIDGALAQDLMKELGIQSVPTVHLDGEPFATGRQDMSSLLEKLEATLDVEESDITQEDRHYDVVVVGGGPAGASAAIYTARKGLKTAIVSENVGGQVKETKGIENLISTPFIEGPQLAEKLREHVDAYPIDIIENQKVEKVTRQNENNSLHLKGGLNLHTENLIAATGARWRELNIPGEKEYLGSGVAFCPHCDGPFYKNKKIAVIGGGNSGVEAALDLAGICDHVTIIEFGGALKADQVLLDKVETAKNINAITNGETLKIEGDGKVVTGLKYKDRNTNREITLELAGVFIQIGLIPNSSWISDHVETTSFGEIVVNERNHTSTAGIYAAGDVSTVPYKQIVIAMGEGAKAGLAAFERHLKS